MGTARQRVKVMFVLSTVQSAPEHVCSARHCTREGEKKAVILKCRHPSKGQDLNTSTEQHLPSQRSSSSSCDWVALKKALFKRAQSKKYEQEEFTTSALQSRDLPAKPCLRKQDRQRAGSVLCRTRKIKQSSSYWSWDAALHILPVTGHFCTSFFHVCRFCFLHFMEEFSFHLHSKSLLLKQKGNFLL